VLSKQQNKEQLEEFYRRQILESLDNIKDLVMAGKVPRGSVVSLQEFVTSWDKLKKDSKVE